MGTPLVGPRVALRIVLVEPAKPVSGSFKNIGTAVILFLIPFSPSFFSSHCFSSIFLSVICCFFFCLPLCFFLPSLVSFLLPSFLPFFLSFYQSFCLACIFLSFSLCLFPSLCSSLLFIDRCIQLAFSRSPFPIDLSIYLSCTSPSLFLCISLSTLNHLSISLSVHRSLCPSWLENLSKARKVFHWMDIPHLSPSQSRPSPCFHLYHNRAFPFCL